MTMTLPFAQRPAVALLLLMLSCTITTLVSSQKFEPYELNGGLVSAVAGRNYCLLAADTRMMDGGYQIYTRSLMRLWGIDGSKLLLPEVMDQEVSCNIKSSTLVAAAGCASDCDALKRQLTFQLRAHGDTTTIPTRSVAQLVSQTLYSRRTFPYYSFCVVGGLLNENDEAGGTVYVYDAIGSMEQVAVATAGTGRELLQPIMDRLFSSSVEERNQVDCSSDEAIARVVEAYHAVAEREIGVGDSVVLCLLEPSTSEGGDPAVVKCRIIRVPLKKH